MAEVVTVDDILSELETAYRPLLRQEGDIDAKQLGAKLQVTDRRGLQILKEIAEKDARFDALLVYDADASHKIWVLRKIA